MRFKCLIQRAGIWHPACHFLAEDAGVTMAVMAGCSEYRGWKVWPMMLLLAALAGCSHQSGLRAAEGPPDQGQDVPFHPTVVSPATLSTGSAKADSTVPFNNSPLVTLPAGTLCFGAPGYGCPGSETGTGREFSAVVDAPVKINGSIVLARGTTVAGRVEWAHTSGGGSGFRVICLTLSSVSPEGKPTPMQTSRLFARGDGDGEGSSRSDPTADFSAIHLGKGHRLTFRLSKDVALARPGQADGALSQGAQDKSQAPRSYPDFASIPG